MRRVKEQTKNANLPKKSYIWEDKCWYGNLNIKYHEQKNLRVSFKISAACYFPSKFTVFPQLFLTFAIATNGKVQIERSEKQSLTKGEEKLKYDAN